MANSRPAALACCCVAAATAGADPPIFTEEAAASGLDFVHFNGMSGELYFPEMMGAGVALFDYDNDGDLDVYFVQGHMLGPGKTVADATFPPRHPLPLVDRLYRNDSGSAGLRFTDVTDESKIRAGGYGMGVAAGDIDNDGWIDLYVMNYGSNQLWRNRGDGTFEDITATAGVDDPRWSVSAAFFDYDRDGLLDLYVGNYLKHDLGKQRTCRLSKLVADYCGPLISDGETDSLFHNLGGGRFEDVSVRAGVTQAFGGALGVVAADLDADGWIDIYVANDGSPNLLWINQRDGTFKNEALLAGAAVNKDGRPEASMGVDADDFDNDGDFDLFMTHLTGETNTLYVNDGRGWFTDETTTSGLGGPSFSFTGFGTAWLDYDNDGRLDLLVVNGAVRKIDALVRAGDPYPLHQRNRLYANRGGGRYEDISDRAGPVFALSEVSRGAAFGDIDNDGDTDVVVSNNSGPARLLVNQAGAARKWLGVRLVDADGRDLPALRAGALLDGAPPLWRRVHADGSYASSNDPRIIFGLDGSPAAAGVRVVWIDGVQEEWRGLELNRYHALRRGSGMPVENEGAGQ
ncbi:MAG TPA: CRTAC1 family protein [Gammaproteobacteria bacterium]|nr:CRTAC1 family protein [Gammaproteobacteria bacterium]